MKLCSTGMLTILLFPAGGAMFFCLAPAQNSHHQFHPLLGRVLLRPGSLQVHWLTSLLITEVICHLLGKQ